jgi:hypothetical protein
MRFLSLVIFFFRIYFFLFASCFLLSVSERMILLLALSNPEGARLAAHVWAADGATRLLRDEHALCSRRDATAHHSRRRWAPCGHCVCSSRRDAIAAGRV